MYYPLRALRRLLLLLLLLALPSLGLRAQQTTYSISGTILDEAGEALPSATISLLLPDGKLKGGITSGKDGSFVLRNVAQGSYTLRITFVVYKAQTRPIKIANKNLQLGKIMLEEDGRILSDVQVVAKANEVVVKGDTLEYNATSYTTQQGAAIIELLKKLPGARLADHGRRQTFLRGRP